jgi:site-specific DNA-methyltransferase (adenine-specific)
MITDRRIKSIHDFPNSKDCFPGVSISGGVNYFLWDKAHNGNCEFASCTSNGVENFETTLDQFPIVVRYKAAKKIIDSAVASGFPLVSSYVSSINAFDLSSAFRGELTRKSSEDVKVTHSKGVGYASRGLVKDDLGLVDKYKVVVSRTVAEHANEPNKDGTFKVLSKVMLLPPGEACTHSYLVVGAFDNEVSANEFKSMLYTKTARYLILQTLTGIDLSRERFCFVPFLNTGETVNDEIVYSKLKLTDESIKVIESLIRHMDN